MGRRRQESTAPAAPVRAGLSRGSLPPQEVQGCREGCNDMRAKGGCNQVHVNEKRRGPHVRVTSPCFPAPPQLFRNLEKISCRLLSRFFRSSPPVSQQAERVGRAAASFAAGIAASARCETVWLPPPRDAPRLFPRRRRSRSWIWMSKVALALSQL